MLGHTVRKRTPQLNILFAAHEGDQLGMQALGYLQSFGLDTHRVPDGETAPVGAICIYTSDNWVWTSKHLRIAAHRLFPGRPQWAITSPFLAEIKPQPGKNVDAALFELARMYKLWAAGDSGVSVPWECLNNRSSTYTALLEEWFDLLADALGSDLTDVLMNQMPLVQNRGRGGEVAYRLMETGRVVMHPADLSRQVPGNSVYEALTGFTKPVVSYGTSDLANTFELLQALKLGHHLCLPVVFENYPGAHNWGYWLDGFLLPSLRMLRVDMADIDFGISPESKYTTLVPAKFYETLRSHGLVSAASFVEKYVGQPLHVMYTEVMRTIAKEFLGTAGSEVDFALTTTEQIAAQTEVWQMSARTLAKAVHEAAGHGVVVFNGPQGQQVRSDNWRRLPDESVSRLHREGWWLGGAALYYMLFRLGLYGGLVTMVKDSTAGRVNLMARPYLQEGSYLQLSPVGLFRLTSQGQNEDWSIDPIIFWELLQRWGAVKSGEELLKIWNAMEVPLMKEHIGRKTVATVTKEGISIRVES
jgi:hypothetical protein